MIIAACGLVGFSMAAACRREEKALRRLMAAMDHMACELQYRLTPLPELCRKVGREPLSFVDQIFIKLASELEAQICPDVESCMCAAMAAAGELPRRVREAFCLLGISLGRFDLEGQLRGLEEVRSYCGRELEGMSANRDNRLRGYQTLGLCAGAALAILLV